MQINERIRFLRKEHLNLTLDEMSKRLNISLSNLGNIETGKIGVTQRVITDICREFSVSTEWLETGEGDVYDSSIKNDKIHNKIRLIRKSLDMTQSEFGDSLGVNRTVIKNYELGITDPSKLFIDHLCARYNVSRKWLDSGIGDMFSDEQPNKENGMMVRIRLVRKHLNMTQTEFGEAMGVSREVINTYEHGTVKPTEVFLNYLSIKYNINLTWLKTGTGNMTSESSDLQDTDILCSSEFIKAFSSLDSSKIDRYISFIHVLRDVSNMNDEERDMLKLYISYIEN